MFREIAAYVLWASWLHLGQNDCADVLGIQGRTLHRWLAQRRQGRRPPPRGRPKEPIPYETRCFLIALLVSLGPDVSQRTFLDCVGPLVPARDAIRTLERFRRAYDWKNGRGYLHHLHWERVGTVWAMDHSDPDAPLERPFKKLFNVRDLASGTTIAADPSRGETAQEVCNTLMRLFARHGPPLVIKSDNGPAFRSDEVARLLARHRVIHLFSPPQSPAYNGAVEAGNGGVKTRIHLLAAAHGHPGLWTLNDVEGARLAANETGHCPVADGLSPDDAWTRRRPITDAERDAFAAALRERLTAVLADQGEPVLPIEFYARKALERQAIVATLTQCGYLSFRRCRFTGRNRHRKWDRI